MNFKIWAFAFAMMCFVGLVGAQNNSEQVTINGNENIYNRYTDSPGDWLSQPDDSIVSETSYYIPGYGGAYSSSNIRFHHDHYYNVYDPWWNLNIYSTQYYNGVYTTRHAYNNWWYSSQRHSYYYNYPVTYMWYPYVFW